MSPRTELGVPPVVEVEFDDFGWELIREEAARQGVSMADVVRHATLYFFADRGGERLSRRISPFKRRGRHEQVAPRTDSDQAD